MRIYNKMKNTAFFRYAGRGIRGVDLKPSQESPDLSVLRMNDMGVQKDLRIGNIGVIVTQAEMVTLKGTIPEDLMAKCTVIGDTKSETAKVATIAFDPPPAPVPVKPEPDPKADTLKPVVFVKDPPKPVVDPIKDEVTRVVAATAEPARQARIDQLKASENPAVVRAAEAVQKEQEAKPAPAPEGWADKDDSDDPAVPGAAAINTAKYKGLSRALLFSECLKRGINDVNPGTKIKDMRRRLAENDLKKKKPAPAAGPR